MSFSELLLADSAEATLLVLFIPSADRAGKALGNQVQRRWIRKALKLVGESSLGVRLSRAAGVSGGMTLQVAGSFGTNRS